MRLTIDVASKRDLQLIIQYLKLLPEVKVMELSAENSTLTVQEPVPANDYSKYWGSVKSEMSTEEIDATIKNMRDEWELDT